MKSENKDIDVVLIHKYKIIFFFEIRTSCALKAVLKLEKLAFYNIRMNFHFVNCYYALVIKKWVVL